MLTHLTRMPPSPQSFFPRKDAQITIETRVMGSACTPPVPAPTPLTLNQSEISAVFISIKQEKKFLQQNSVVIKRSVINEQKRNSRYFNGVFH
jgi:hypothetical protein